MDKSNVTVGPYISISENEVLPRCGAYLEATSVMANGAHISIELEHVAEKLRLM